MRIAVVGLVLALAASVSGESAAQPVTPAEVRGVGVVSTGSSGLVSLRDAEGWVRGELGFLLAGGPALHSSSLEDTAPPSSIEAHASYVLCYDHAGCQVATRVPASIRETAEDERSIEFPVAGYGTLSMSLFLKGPSHSASSTTCIAHTWARGGAGTQIRITLDADHASYAPLYDGPTGVRGALVEGTLGTLTAHSWAGEFGNGCTKVLDVGLLSARIFTEET